MKYKILIVDDSPLVHQMCEAELKSEKYTILHASDGMEGIKTTFAELPDLIILDVNMPKVNGYQVCRLLKDHSYTKHIPIIVQTNSQSVAPITDPRKWSFETGADGYLDKGDVGMLESYIQPFLKKVIPSEQLPKLKQSISEIEILTSLSQLLDKHLYTDIKRLEELNEKKSAFVANVSHELKSPLGIIWGNIDYLESSLNDRLDERQKRVFGTTVKTIHRITRLINDLLDLAKIESGKLSLKKEAVNLNELIQEVFETYALTIEEREIDVQYEIPKLTPIVIGDKDRLSQVVINLFNNALKFVDSKDGRITLRVKEIDSLIKLEIEDNGSGISKENLEKIFDKFERVTAEKKEGTGLGLPIAKDIVSLHGGKIWAESVEGKGSKFIVSLPCK